MESRRNFLKVTAAAAAASRSILGANDRVRMGIIGTGTRGNQVHSSFIVNKDVEFVAACDVAKSRLDQFATKVGGKIATYADWRKVIDSKDVDAVLITTPDHWHSPIMVAACEAGKDVYVEKPVSNAIAPAQKMVEAARKYNRVVQAGLQQRSWPHFQECVKIMRDGTLGTVGQCVMIFSGGGWGPTTPPPEQPTAPPADLDWEMFQGPAERHPYVASRQRNWRNYYDYGCGTVTDWGAHLLDVMLWYMDADKKQPQLTAGIGQYIGQINDPARTPETFTCTWKFDKFVATFMNAVPPRTKSEPDSDLYGNYFHGTRGMLLVSRYGWEIRPVSGRRSQEGANLPPVEYKNAMDPKGMSENPNSPFGSSTVRHTRNFLDCVKSRQRPNADIEIGFNSCLPAFLASMSIRQGKTMLWDGKVARPA
jgi:predicted dehydrogenase